MNFSAAKQRVLGLTWRRLGRNSNENDENVPISSPVNKPNKTKEDSKLQRGTVTRRSLRRIQSVRDVFGSLRQKLRTSTRRRKRLITSSPYTPKRRTNASGTPTSTQRRSSRIARIQEENMYSPFSVDTPSKTPSKIRMGVHEPKRFNFSSPGQVVRDLNSLTEGIQALTDMSDRLNTVERSGIRTVPCTTPKGSRIKKKPVFV